MTPNELQTALIETIRTFVATSPLNGLPAFGGAPIWDVPLVGFADGDDPLFDLYRSVVSPEHMTPRQVLAAAGAAPDRAGVVSWILPIVAETRQSNAQMAEGPSVRWNHTRFQGETCNDGLRRAVVEFCAQNGLAAVAPGLSTGFRRLRGPWGEASTWSERHVAYAAGLGTFGLSDGLITARGIAHRCGSVVVGVHWPASQRPYTGRHDYCSFYRDGSCGTCIQRCPAGAIGPDGHDKDRCQQYIREVLGGWRTRPGYSGEYLACGLCQTGVPCEGSRPGVRPAEG